MKRDTRLRLGTALIALTVSAALPAAAQEVAPPPTPNADRLAEEMRTLAREPRNVRALLSAGEMSARLNDAAAAAGFFARAQTLDPANPRVLAGQAMVMVRQERPGEALRLFAEAERRGLAMDSYFPDRGLAYDLVGAQGHAQRDYRIAMRNPDDETIRRYALSLGISGQEAEAMRVLDPLLRRSDRAGWRARAFILAMNGDAPGADKIAASMMGGVGSALAPFFRRLPTLSPSDKAFAVHFGELRRTTARIADAQLAPPLPRLGHESGVAVAAVDLPRREPQADPRPVDRRSASSRRRGDREPLGWQANEAADARRAAARLAEERETKRLADLKAQQEREALAARQRDAERIAAEQQAAREAEARRVAEVQARERAAAELAAREAEARRLEEAQRLAEAQRAAVGQPATVQPVAPEAPVVASTSQPVNLPAAASPPPGDTPPARTAEAPPATPRIGGEDNVIARIIAGITIPASELGVEPMPGRPEVEPPAAQPAPPPPVEVAKVETPRPRPVVEKPKPEPVKPKPEPAKPKAEPVKPEPAKAGTRGKPVDPKAATAKPGDPKAAPAKGAVAAKAPAKGKGKPEPAKPDPAKTDPARHWVQVAGGANVSDLPKAWRALIAKAPAELRGRQTWTTPLRFTNRLLVGPFKTPAEAQAFVNAIGKKGIPAFAWSSEAGQKIEKLAVK
ncbi:SPOR domain-containing protein [Sphingomonas koreensis]